MSVIFYIRESLISDANMVHADCKQFAAQAGNRSLEHRPDVAARNPFSFGRKEPPLPTAGLRQLSLLCRWRSEMSAYFFEASPRIPEITMPMAKANPTDFSG